MLVLKFCLPALQRGHLQYNLFGPCSRCSRYKVSCSRVKGCAKCKGDNLCEPSSHEIVTRSKTLFKQILLGELIHNDYVKYQLNLQSTVYGCKAVVARKDMKEILHRISKASIPDYGPEVGDLSKLPEDIKNHIGDCPTFKIEWMRNGRYSCAMSEPYGTNFITENRILEIAKSYSIPPKIIDESGLNDYDVSYKMWIESVFSPCTNITYTGSGYWKGDNKVCYTTVRMMSIIINHEYIITSTTVGRGSIYVF